MKKISHQMAASPTSSQDFTPEQPPAFSVTEGGLSHENTEHVKNVEINLINDDVERTVIDLDNIDDDNDNESQVGYEETFQDMGRGFDDPENVLIKLRLAGLDIELSDGGPPEEKQLFKAYQANIRPTQKVSFSVR